MVARHQRPIVFVAGPYSAPTAEGEARNIRNAVDIGRILFEKGYYPIVPHLMVREYYTSEDATGPFGYDAMLQYTLAIVPRCDALLLYGHSFGADRECELARSLGKPVYHDVSELPGLT